MRKDGNRRSRLATNGASGQGQEKNGREIKHKIYGAPHWIYQKTYYWRSCCAGQDLGGVINLYTLVLSTFQFRFATGRRQNPTLSTIFSAQVGCILSTREAANTDDFGADPSTAQCTMLVDEHSSFHATGRPKCSSLSSPSRRSRFMLFFKYSNVSIVVIADGTARIRFVPNPA